jgi:hypothetical protein
LEIKKDFIAAGQDALPYIEQVADRWYADL